MKRSEVSFRCSWESLGSRLESGWDGAACYRFLPSSTAALEQAAVELHDRCLDAVEHAVRNDLLDRFRIAPRDRRLVIESWERREPTLFGRFDLQYDGEGPPKLLEYNADTPATLVETAVVQRAWRDELFPGADQLNRIDEALVETWRNLRIENDTIHFSSIAGSQDERCDVEYLAATARAAGFTTACLDVEAVSWCDQRQRFVAPCGSEISTWFKLYPWRMLLDDPYGEHIHRAGMRLIEPAWKALLANKEILVLLWELFPDHPNLLPAYHDPKRLGRRFVTKPIFGRAGSNISIHDGKRTVRSPGPFHGEPMIHQEFAPLPCFDNRYPLVGLWMIGGKPSGMGIRESSGLISDYDSTFVPHLVMQ